MTFLFCLRAALNKTYYHEPIVAKTKSIDLNSSEILDTLPTDRKNELKVNIKRELLFIFIRIYSVITSYVAFKIEQISIFRSCTNLSLM